MRLRWLVLLIPVLLLAACGPSEAPLFRGGPRLSPEVTSVDLGEVKVGTETQVRFVLRNVGDAPLIIQEAVGRVVEGCCPPPVEVKDKTIPPGGKGTILAVVRMPEDVPIPHRFEIIVRSNDAVEPEARLEIKAVFIP